MAKFCFTSVASFFFFFFTFLVSQHQHVRGQIPTTPTFFNYICIDDAGNYTSNSSYHSHLNHLLSNLTAHAVHSAYYNASTGTNTHNPVYGQYYCRADISTHLCHSCVQQAAHQVTANCSNTKAAIVWFEECTLSYHNHSTVAVEKEYPRSWWYSTDNVTDGAEFSRALGDTMDSLIDKSAKGQGLKMFATGEGRTKKEKVYCLVQCSPDIDGASCKKCLHTAVSFLPTCCGNASKSVLVFFQSCQVRYSTIKKFYEIPASPAPSPDMSSPPLTQPDQPPTPALTATPPSPSPSSSSSPSAPGGSTILKCSQRMKLGVSIMALSLLVLMENFN